MERLEYTIVGKRERFSSLEGVVAFIGNLSQEELKEHSMWTYCVYGKNKNGLIEDNVIIAIEDNGGKYEPKVVYQTNK